MMGKCAFLFLSGLFSPSLTLTQNSNFRYLQWQLTSTISTIAASLNLSSAADLTPILHQKLAQSICDTAAKFCTGANQQYANQTACEKHLGIQTRFGEGWEWGMDTVSCRMVSYLLPLFLLFSLLFFLPSKYLKGEVADRCQT
jgi:hypothetical protein